jgi:hypothetical protein
MDRKWVGVGLSWVLALLGGCGTAAKPGADAVSKDPIASCDSFAQMFENCQSKLGASPAVAHERAATTRETLHTQTLTATTEAARDALDAQCTAGLKQLAMVCP